MEALGHKVNLESLKIKIGVAVPDAYNIDEEFEDYSDMIIYSVKCNLSEWNNKIIDANIEMNKVFKVQEKAI